MSNREALQEMASGYVRATRLKIYQVAWAPKENENKTGSYHTINIAASTVEEAMAKAKKQLALEQPVDLLYIELLATETNLT